MQRHPHDSVVADLWPGAADPKSERYVPVELRDTVASMPADVEQDLRRHLYRTKETYRTDSRGGQQSRSLNPAENLDDMEVALVWRKVEWTRQRLAGEAVVAEQAARGAATYTCRGCGEVVPPNAIDPATTRSAAGWQTARSSSSSAVRAATTPSCSPPRDASRL